MGSDKLEARLKEPTISERHALALFRQAADRSVHEPEHLYSGEKLLEIAAGVDIQEEMLALLQEYLSPEQQAQGALNEQVRNTVQNYKLMLQCLYQLSPPHHTHSSRENINDDSYSSLSVVQDIAMSRNKPGTLTITYKSCETVKKLPPKSTWTKLATVYVTELRRERRLSFLERCACAINVLRTGQRPTELLVARPAEAYDMKVKLFDNWRKTIPVDEFVQIATGRKQEQKYALMVHAMAMTFGTVEKYAKPPVKE